MRSSLIYTGKKISFNYNEQVVFQNIIQNEDDFEIRKSLEDHKANSISARLELYFQQTKIGDLIEYLNLICVLIMICLENFASRENGVDNMVHFNER